MREHSFIAGGEGVRESRSNIIGKEVRELRSTAGVDRRK